METTSKLVRSADYATGAKSELLLPPLALSSCLFGLFVRDTRGTGFSFEKRFSHFAASPLCCISWIFEGDGFLLDHDQQMGDPSSGQIVPRVSVSGPQTCPRTTWSSGESFGMILALYPDAFSLLTDVSPGSIIDQTMDVEEVLTGEMLELAVAVGQDANSNSGYRLILERLDRLWPAVRPGELSVVNRVSDWTRTLMTRAMFSAVGRSARQMERRVKFWTGQSQRNLDQFARTDWTFERALAQKSAGELKLAELSLESGFADQAHMTRFVKKQTGYSPAELMHRIENDEAFWSFRLMGERY